MRLARLVFAALAIAATVVAGSSDPDGWGGAVGASLISPSTGRHETPAMNGLDWIRWAGAREPAGRRWEASLLDGRRRATGHALDGRRWASAGRPEGRRWVRGDAPDGRRWSAI